MKIVTGTLLFTIAASLLDTVVCFMDWENYDLHQATAKDVEDLRKTHKSRAQPAIYLHNHIPVFEGLEYTREAGIQPVQQSRQEPEQQLQLVQHKQHLQQLR
ncbi:uncharacterized protein LOC117168863 [Belonocnema kinseyi]|uniref:uncharacterized protein LOC117168863 n=1 Tax=Belonocnema kinseyi TaxID=2817044 RepID=UPI00143D23D5|nr:uncharacterized protein LOC117168863 [Belonocnema kinseyi]